MASHGDQTAKLSVIVDPHCAGLLDKVYRVLLTGLSDMTPAATAFGSIFQIAYVPADIDAALAFWTRTMRVGPFFRRGPLRMSNCRFMDTATDPEFSLWIAYWGELQIELVQQHNHAPSIYSTWRAEQREGVHHVCTSVPDIVAARAECLSAGWRIVQEADYPGGGVFYADTGGGPGTMVEVMQVPAATAERFAMIRAAARDWDGSDPIRE